MKNTLALIAAALALAGCAGTTPAANSMPGQGMSAVIVAGRFILPTGETRSGSMVLNFEGEGGRQAEIYRLNLLPGEASLYQVEPGVYHINPTRNLFGYHRPGVKVQIEGRVYEAPFPKELLRKSSIEVKSKKIVALGVVEARVSSALPGQQPSLRVRIDDSVNARRQLVSQVIHNMMDPNVPAQTRESAIAWSRALESSLMDLLSESERAPLYKRAP
jgi:hypothetical protein